MQFSGSESELVAMFKHAYSGLLIINGLIESVAAVTLILGPGGIHDIGAGGQWSMHYGFAVIAIASLGLWLWPYRTNFAVCSVALGFLTLFHFSLMVSLALAGDQPGGLVTHGVIAIWSGVLFAFRGRWCDG